VVTRRVLSAEERRGLRAQINAASRTRVQDGPSGRYPSVAELAYQAAKGDPLIALDLVVGQLVASSAPTVWDTPSRQKRA
jgi:hypothetical protein